MPTKKKASPKKPSNEKVRWLSPDVLGFDIKNPRLSQSNIGDDIDEPDMIQFLWKEMNVEELALSIAEWGYYEHEPLIAVKKGSRYTVIEGNRRLAAVKILRDRDLRRDIKTDLPRLSAAVAADLEQLPVVITTRKKVWQYIGFKHVNGPKPWGAFAKAEYIARVHNDFDVPLEDIPRLIGDTHATVLQLHRALLLIEQATRTGVWNVHDRWHKRLYFSHLPTALTHRSVQKFLGLEAENKYVANPVCENKLFNLGELCVWLFGSKSANRPPIICYQNPDVRDLSELLETTRSTDALRGGLSLQTCLDATKDPGLAFRQALSEAKSILTKACEISTTLDTRRVESSRLTNDVYRLAESLMEVMAEPETLACSVEK